MRKRFLNKQIILRAPGRRSLLDRRLWLSNLRHVCGDSFHALRCSGTSGVEMKIYEWSLQALLPLPRPRFCQSPLACLSRVHFSRYPSRLSDLHLILMFSGPLQQDLFKEKWSLAKCTSNKIIVTLVTRFAVFFTLPSCCVNTRNVSLGVLWCEGHFVYCIWRTSFLCDSLWRMIQR